MKDTALNIIPALCRGSLGGSVVKNQPPNEGDAGNAGSIPEQGRSPGVGNGNPLQNSCLGNPMSTGAWQELRESQRVGATEHTLSRLSDLLLSLTFYTFFFLMYFVARRKQTNDLPLNSQNDLQVPTRSASIPQYLSDLFPFTHLFAYLFCRTNLHAVLKCTRHIPS